MTWHKAFSSPNLSVWLGWEWKSMCEYTVTVAKAETIEQPEISHKTF